MANTGFFVRNEGMLDRLLRVVVGAVLLALAFTGPRTPLGYLGIIPLLTGIIGTCPLYSLFGLSTCPMHGRAS